VTSELLSPTVALTRYFVAPDQEHGLLEKEARSLPIQRYGFRIGTLRLVHDLKLPIELMEPPRCFELPNSAQWFSGLVNLRGNLVPVFDLKSLLGETDVAGQRRMLVVIGSGERAAALIIDGTPDHISVDVEIALEKPDEIPEILQDHFEGAYHYAGETWYQADYEGVFASLAQRSTE